MKDFCLNIVAVLFLLIGIKNYHHVSAGAVRPQVKPGTQQALQTASSSSPGRGPHKKPPAVPTEYVEYTSNLIGVTHLFRGYQLNNTDDLLALKEFAKDLENLNSSSVRRTSVSTWCNLKPLGKGWGQHTICSYNINKEKSFSSIFSSSVSKQQRHRSSSNSSNLLSTSRHLSHQRNQHSCFFFSFGISTDFSFDTHLVEDFDCKGYAFDPTSNHPTNLTRNVIFMKTSAHSPVRDKRWSHISIPAFRSFVERDLFVLKMDCESCEYSLAFDILNDDPSFFDHILQFNIELHFPRRLMKSDNAVCSLGRLFRLLKLSSFELVHVDDGHCSLVDEEEGCIGLFVESGIPCLPGCRSFHFAKKLENYFSIQ
jgi:hypothetical protein